MNEQIEAALATWPIFAAIAAVTAGALWAEDKAELRRLDAENADLRDELAERGTRADELTRRRHERIRAAMGDGAVFVPGQRTGGE